MDRENKQERSMKRENTSAVTALQVKALQKRLDSMRSRYLRVMRDQCTPKDPVRVAKARAIVKAFDTMADSKGDDGYMKARARMKMIEDEILFGDMTKARELLDEVATVISHGS